MALWMLARHARPPAHMSALFGETFVRPAQWQTTREVSADSRGVRAFYARLLWYALRDAGLAPWHGRTRPALRTLAQRWLAGEPRRCRGRSRHRRLRCARPRCYRPRRGRTRACPAVIVPGHVVPRRWFCGLSAASTRCYRSSASLGASVPQKREGIRRAQPVYTRGVRRTTDCFFYGKRASSCARDVHHGDDGRHGQD